nr:MAG TPA: hypothetical protein [Caudoviricetes sp.]
MGMLVVSREKFTPYSSSTLLTLYYKITLIIGRVSLLFCC